MFKKISNKVKSAVCSVKATVASRKAEGYVDSGVKILIAVVIGALLLAGLYALFNTTIAKPLEPTYDELNPPPPVPKEYQYHLGDTVHLGIDEYEVLAFDDTEVTLYDVKFPLFNKTYALPSTYNPGVDPVANAALQEMFAAAKLDGINLYVRSGFRSYATQKSLYEGYVKRDGVAGADRYSARAGHSEHQTGLAFDINNASSSFIGTAEANWLAANCHKYGFIVRYPSGKESITGYKYEPWHIRYLGVEVATSVYESGLCLEEYLGITSVYQY